MKSILVLIAAISIALSSCASMGIGPIGGGVPVFGYDAFYDDVYGPFYDGYWGGDGAFYYRGGAGRPYARDGGGHFRHGPASGFHGVRSSGGRR